MESLVGRIRADKIPPPREPPLLTTGSHWTSSPVGPEKPQVAETHQVSRNQTSACGRMQASLLKATRCFQSEAAFTARPHPEDGALHADRF